LIVFNQGENLRFWDAGLTGGQAQRVWRA